MFKGVGSSGKTSRLKEGQMVSNFNQLVASLTAARITINMFLTVLKQASIKVLDCSLPVPDMLHASQKYVFSCDSSSISHDVGLSVGVSVPNEFYRSVIFLLVYLCCS